MRENIKSNLPQKQVVLPFKKSVEIAVKSIKSRFFRTLITTMSLILAISFYTYITVNLGIISSIALSHDQNAIQRLSLQGIEIPEQGQPLVLSPQERWILFLSLLVCVVGIVNTQLMAVADRFREIGTMKCLGALDRFILRLFLIEAALQGIIGSALGGVAGALIAFLGALLKYGSPIVVLINLNHVSTSILSGIAIGCLLSIIGVLYPALLAAKMQPVEAMRGRD